MPEEVKQNGRVRSFSSVFDVDVHSVWDYENSAEQYRSAGGTSKEAVLVQIEKLKTSL